MTDQPGAGWQPPGGPTAGPGDGDPPPPPPPPVWPAADAAPDPDEDVVRWDLPIQREGDGEAPNAWGPPPSPSRTRTGVIVAAVAIVLIGAGVGLVLTAGDEADDTVPVDAQPFADPADAELASLLSTIDASERRMINFQADVSDQVSDSGLLDAAAVERAGSDAARDLAAIREDLVLHARDGGTELDGIRAIRDSYRDHLDAWIAYAEAVAAAPDLAVEGGESFWDDIDRTADVFVLSVVRDLPDDAPQDLVDRANAILERGFGGVPSSDLV